MDLTLALAGLGVGIVVGLTGMGGGALMTPILVLLFHVHPVAAVSSDLAASAIMKPFGGAVHAKRGTVNWKLVGWLCAGSIPCAFLGVLLLRLLGDDKTVQTTIQYALGAALVLAATGIVVKAWVSRQQGDDKSEPEPIVVKPVPTLLLGAAGGLVVGLTSVGSGSLIIVALLAMYPKLRANHLVGTDIVQAIPLVMSAALGHWLFGDLQWNLAGTVVLGSIPGVLIGSRISSRAPSGVIRPALVIVLLASSLKLFGVSTALVGIIIGVATLVAIGLGLNSRAKKRRAIEQAPESDQVNTTAEPAAAA